MTEKEIKNLIATKIPNNAFGEFFRDVIFAEVNIDWSAVWELAKEHYPELKAETNFAELKTDLYNFTDSLYYEAQDYDQEEELKDLEQEIKNATSVEELNNILDSDKDLRRAFEEYLEDAKVITE